jgi:peptidoglycan/xylan/chitin deacetylase (PgdA/CDA1 family)
MKRAFFDISSALGFDRLFTFVNRHRPIVLGFHGVSAETPGSIHNYEGSHLHRPIFSRLMEYLVDRYRVVSLEEIVDWLEGVGGLPERAVVVTFDDGYRNVLTQAAPLLSELGAPATVFVTTDFVVENKLLWPDRVLGALAATSRTSLTVPRIGGKSGLPIGDDTEKIHASDQIRSICKSLSDDDRKVLVDDIVDELGVDEAMIQHACKDYAPLSSDDLRKLPTYGITVGSHTCSHPVLARCPIERMADELRRSKRIIEQITGAPCTSFAYPNGGPGDFNDQTRREVVGAGYRCAVTTVKSRLSARQDKFEIPRYVLTHNEITLNEFSVEVSGYPTFLRGIKRKISLQ